MPLGGYDSCVSICVITLDAQMVELSAAWTLNLGYA